MPSCSSIKIKGLFKISCLLLLAMLSGCGEDETTQIVYVPFTTEGTINNPHLIQQSTSDPNTADAYRGFIAPESLYFKVVNLNNKNTAYVVLLYPNSENADLYVYTDKTYSSVSCSSTNTGINFELCVVNTDANGDIYIRVDGTNIPAYIDGTFISMFINLA